MPYIGRLAPSPTGFLHLGHARTFWIAYQRALQHQGTLWLREEDLDHQRSRSEFAAALREDLRWLGIEWQNDAKQSDRLPLYRRAFEKLLASGHVYPCLCSRRDLQQSIAAPHEDTDDELMYPGTCRVSTSLTHSATVNPESSNYRFRVPEKTTITFTDLHAGPQSFKASMDFGDFLVWRKDGLPSYQLACAVDDAAMHITEVVRGRDLLKSTARQILLQRALELPTPAYFHADLIRDGAGLRLAKRHDALSLRTLRASGFSAADIRARF